VSGLDELEGSMAARRVLCGFHEAPKAFPPSYRFHRAPPPSDTSDSSTSTSTSTTKGADPSPLPPPPPHPDFASLPTLQSTYSWSTASFRDATPQLGDQSPFQSQSWPGPSPDDVDVEEGTLPAPSPVLRSMTEDPRKGSGSGVGPGSPPPPSSLRTPSYTDRILASSLPERTGRLRWLHYDLCHAMVSERPPCGRRVELSRPLCRDLSVRWSAFIGRVTWPVVVCGQDLSDHRPVCASLELEVPGQGPNPVGEDSAAGVWVVRLWLGGARVELEGDPAKEGLPPSARPAPAQLTVLYPIVSEDPLAFRRKAAALRLVRPLLSLRRVAHRAWPGIEILHHALSSATRAAHADGPSCLIPRSAPGSVSKLYPPLTSWCGVVVVCVQVGSGSQGAGSGSGVGLSALHRLPWPGVCSGEGLALEVQARPADSQHALLKLSDARGHDLGQAPLSIVQALAQSASNPGHAHDVTLELTSGGARRGSLTVSVLAEMRRGGGNEGLAGGSKEDEEEAWGVKEEEEGEEGDEESSAQ
jgi:hypothetical protein